MIPRQHWAGPGAVFHTLLRYPVRMTLDRNERPLEAGIHTDLSGRMTYGGYLHLDRLLTSQHPLSDPPHHDEMLFIVQHQTSELWLKLMIHELRSARALLADDQHAPALKRLARIKHIQHTLADQWSVLATMTPSEYAEIRPFLATSSGFQSYQYREVEFLLGNKTADMVKVFKHDPAVHGVLAELLHEPSLYDEFLRFLARRGYDVPAELLDRDFSQPYRMNAALVDVVAQVYADPENHWGVYETFEELVDIEDVTDERDADELLHMITRHKEYTGSKRAAEILGDWKNQIKNFKKIIPGEYKKALAALEDEAQKENEMVDESKLKVGAKNG